MATYWTCLLLANCGVMLLHRLSYLQGKNLPKGIADAKKPLLVRVMTPDNLHFGGMQMQSCRLWTLITASFEHAGDAHLVNNMIHFLGFASALETIIGGPALIAAYIATGAAGWGLSYVFTRYHNRGEDWFYWKIYLTTCGSSPATYGLGIATALLAPQSSSMCVLWGLPAWIWIYLLYAAPMVCEEKYNVQPWIKAGTSVDKDKPAASTTCVNTRFFYFVTVTLIMAGLILRPLLAEKHITGTEFFILYLGKTFFFKFVDKIWLGRRFINAGSDHSSHLGGVLMATLSIHALCSANLLPIGPIPLTAHRVLVLSHVGSLCSYLASDPWVRDQKCMHTVIILAIALASCCVSTYVLSPLTTPWAWDTLLLVAANNYLWLRLLFDF